MIISRMRDWSSDSEAMLAAMAARWFYCFLLEVADDVWDGRGGGTTQHHKADMEGFRPGY